MTETADIVKYDITEAAIAEMANIYMNLTIDDLADKEQFDAVHSARMTVKGKRVETEKRRKELKADALEWGRKVDARAKEIFAALEPIESHLDAEERKVTDEQKRIKAEEERLFREKIEGRIAELGKFGKVLPFSDVAGWTDGEYRTELVLAEDEYNKEQARIAAEEAARKAETERLEKQRAEQEAEAAKLADERKKIDDERRAIEEAKRIEAAKAEAAEKARQEERDRIEREQREKEEAERRAKEEAERKERESKEKAEAEEAERVRQEALRPDKEKLTMWASTVLNLAAKNLNVKSDKAREIYDESIRRITDIHEWVTRQTETM